MSDDILTKIEKSSRKFSKGQKLIANYISQHYEKAAFMTAAKLGDTVGVSESTVVRFATEVGFEGYPQLQKNLQEIIRNRLTTVQRMEIIDEQLGNSDVLTKVMTLDSEKIKHTLHDIDREAFKKAVDIIVGADHRYILGVRSSSMLASFLTFYFNHIFPNVINVGSNSTSEVFEPMIRINYADVMIALSFPRYSHRTLKAVQFAKSRGATVIAITDSESSPIAEIADIILIARSDMASFVDSLVAPLSLINALIVAVGLCKKEDISNTYQVLETIWEQYHVYEKSDIEEREQD